MLYDHRLWIEDLDRVIDVIPKMDKLAGRSILITGATGLICSSIVDVLFRYNDTHEEKIQILAAGRAVDSMKRRFGQMIDRNDFVYIPYDASKAGNTIPYHADYMIHGAGNAYPALVMKEPVETMLSNFLGMKYLLDYAKENKTERVLYISSSEVYGKKAGSEPFSESEYGYVDLLNPRNSYASGKRAAETLCASYAAEYGLESVIVRPGHIYGPTASAADSRVSSAWPYNAARGNGIIMKSDGAQVRSYCYCLDCASAILTVLLCGENVHAYNISNPDSIVSIREMAEILTKASGVSLTVESPSETEKRGFNPMDNSSLESSSLLKLGWKGCFDAETGFGHTVELLREEIEHS